MVHPGGPACRNSQSRFFHNLVRDYAGVPFADAVTGARATVLTKDATPCRVDSRPPGCV
jgi:hypothetical protein